MAAGRRGVRIGVVDGRLLVEFMDSVDSGEEQSTDDGVLSRTGVRKFATFSTRDSSCLIKSR